MRLHHVTLCNVIVKYSILATNVGTLLFSCYLLLDSVCTVIEFGICGLSLISVSGLAAMHTWLIARMETTNEDVS